VFGHGLGADRVDGHAGMQRLGWLHEAFLVLRRQGLNRETASASWGLLALLSDYRAGLPSERAASGSGRGPATARSVVGLSTTRRWEAVSARQHIHRPAVVPAQANGPDVMLPANED
jgi:hypothetical protein